MGLIYNIFLKYPDENNMSYGQHFLMHFYLGTFFITCSFKAFIHSFIPVLFKDSITEDVNIINHYAEIINKI